MNGYITKPKGAKWEISPNDKVFIMPSGEWQIRKRAPKNSQGKLAGYVLEDTPRVSMQVFPIENQITQVVSSVSMREDNYE